jgi:hypothetical protein
MSKFDEVYGKYQEAMAGTDYNNDLLTAVTKGLGPSIYLADASLVSCGDQSEKDRVKNNFLIKKHGLTDSAELDAAVTAVCEKMKGMARKPRAIFYYHLVTTLGLEANYAS